MTQDYTEKLELPTLSQEARSMWAKYNYDKDTGIESWEPLAIHLIDAAEVAGLCYREWLSDSQRNLLRNAMPPCAGNKDTLDEKIQKLVMFLTGIHDIGKATPAFSSQVDYLYQRMAKAGLSCTSHIQPQQRKSLPHGCAGQVILTQYLESKGYESVSATALGSVIGGHHGTSPTRQQIEIDNINQILMGDDKWEAARTELINYISKYVGWETVEADFAHAKWNKAQLALLQGIIIMADWIASNKNFFPLFQIDSPDDSAIIGSLLGSHEIHLRRVNKAWDAIHLPSRWQPENTSLSADALLASRFNFPSEAKARPLQEKAVKLAKTMDLPGMLILEDMMGAGKTEASLLAAEVLAARSGAAGVIVALPTQVTTDAMFKRVLNWLPKILTENTGSFEQTVSLIHGKANLNEEFSELQNIHTETIGNLYFNGEYTDIGVDECEVTKGETESVAVKKHEWMMSAKKNLLADFVVGTIDQVLMMALQSRYLTLRHLGMSRKVVILDEIHSCDIYMSEYLKMALEWLGAYKIPVIALSATLAPNVRKSLIEAYERGANFKFTAERPARPGRHGKIAATGTLPTTPNFDTLGEICYPVASVKKQGNYHLEPIKPAFPSRKVKIEKGDWENAANIAQELITEGGNLLILHNTVKRAQHTYRLLTKQTDIPIRLVHARYTAIDRIENDRWLLQTYGRKNQANHPEKSIVIATQVVEQSLDVDFDAIITDLAPIDLIYQRIGRVHRHAENKRPKSLGQAKCIVLGIPELEETELQKQQSIVKNIYPPLHLLKTADLLNQVLENRGYLTLPDDMAAQVAHVYGATGISNANWKEQLKTIEELYHEKMQNQRSLAHHYRLGAISDYPQTNLNDWLNFRSDPNEKEGRAAVRLGEESLEVILVEQVQYEDGTYWKLLNHLPEIGGRILPWSTPPSWTESRMLLLSKARLPYGLTTGYRIDSTIEELEQNYCPAWQENKLLAGELVLALNNGSAELGGKTLRYTPEGGLEEVQNGS